MSIQVNLPVVDGYILIYLERMVVILRNTMLKLTVGSITMMRTKHIMGICLQPE